MNKTTQKKTVKKSAKKEQSKRGQIMTALKSVDSHSAAVKALQPFLGRHSQASLDDHFFNQTYKGKGKCYLKSYCFQSADFLSR